MIAERLVAAGLILGEGPISTGGDRFACVDIRGFAVHGGALDGSFDTLHAFESPVSSICLTHDDHLLATVGTELRALEGAEVIALESPDADIRLNDGKPDPSGRFVGGTMAEPPRPGAGRLFSFDRGRARVLLDGVTISNGICWSADGETMFYVDTPTQRIDAFDYDLSTGKVSGRRTVAHIPDAVGSPDGMTVDADGGLWVALWGGSAVHRYAGGELTEIVEVPTPYVTCPTFVGDDLGALLVTTASEPNRGEPGAGDLYVARPGACGLAPHRALQGRIFGR